MRATFTTEFIYDGAEGYLDRRAKIYEVLGCKVDMGGGNVIGQLAGVTKGLDLSEEDVRRYIDEICNELYHIAKVDFKIVWLLEGGDIIIRNILGKKVKL